MVVGVARASLVATKVFKFNITSSTMNANLRTLANNAGYNGYGDVIATINSGVYLYAGSTGSYGLEVGTFSSGSVITLINQGWITGAGGAGGTALKDFNGPSPVLPGAGGPAFYAAGVSGFTFKFDNSAGVIAGGGGGGGYGGGSFGGASGFYTDPEGNEIPFTLDFRAGGGGGGGGRGNIGGAGGGFGSLAGASGNPGTAGGISSAGTGGIGAINNDGFTAGAGGNGGSWGASGSPGLAPVTPQFGYDVTNTGNSSGAAGGAAVIGNSNITWISTGTRYGSIS